MKKAKKKDGVIRPFLFGYERSGWGCGVSPHILEDRMYLLANAKSTNALLLEKVTKKASQSPMCFDANVSKHIRGHFRQSDEITPVVTNAVCNNWGVFRSMKKLNVFMEFRRSAITGVTTLKLL